MMKICEKCGGLGCKTEKGKTVARAEICECKKNCAKCGGRGFDIARRQDGYRYKIPCRECSAVYANIKKYNCAQIPAVMAFAELKPPQNTKASISAVEYICRFINSYPREKGFVLAGSPGRGKTFLAAATVAEQTLKRGVDCLFQDFNDLILKIKDRSREVSEYALLEPLFKTEILVVDGVGFGGRGLTDWEKSVLENVVSRRYGAGGKLILTAKHGRSELETEMGDQGFSRLSRMCEFLSLD